jgi:4-hydroxybenzoate polyprenyltransferase
LASGALTYKQASAFLFGHLAGGLLVLHYLNWNSIALSFGIVPVMSLYPLAKRYTNYPQVVLGDYNIYLSQNAILIL